MNYDPSSVAFVDCETLGLDPDRHDVWEVGLIVDGVEYQWFLPCRRDLADPAALAMNRFAERYPAHVTPLSQFAPALHDLTDGRHLVGANPRFDEERLRKMLHRAGLIPGWHYHLIDVEALALGCVAAGRADEWAHFYDKEIYATPLIPWKSTDLGIEVGVNPTEFDRHTALGDARWAKAVFEKIMGGPTA